MKKCDLVMKGGITSGIVYPGAVCELAKEFRFVNIGGTSAGAIAAAITAAAEYRRQNGSEAGFDELARLPHWLAEDSRLLSLFQPERETASLFALVLAYLEKRSVLRVLVTRFHRYGSMVLALAVLIAILLTLFANGIGAWIVLALALVACAIAFVGAAIVQALVTTARVLPRHGFGLCSGDVLSAWLASKIDEVAGLERPLTFGDLAACGINLEMMTTNLTHGRPYRVPFETRQLWFAPSELRRLFPESVVEWMIAHARAEKRRQKSDSGEELLPLPSAEALPVIVATRMSLSFPILLSAVPLWSLDFGRRERPVVPERCWFSDGGITSNFPVHFFDKALPRWPTFAFNLADWTPRYHEPGQRVYTPRSNRGGISEWWQPVRTLGEFLHAIVNTMQNWRDNMLLRMPGQRDRIAHVLLEGDEGGLNLAMEPETIQRVAAKGAEAAARLRERFGDVPPPGTRLTWKNHRWVRFLSFMPALEETLEQWSEAFSEELFDDPPSYRVTPREREPMRAASLAFLRHVQSNFGSRPFRRTARRPRPEPQLRPMPRV